jgi:hypothetical protein
MAESSNTAATVFGLKVKLQPLLFNAMVANFIALLK